MTEFRPIRVLSTDATDPLIAASAAEGYRFIARLVAEWDAGVMRFDGPGELLLGGYDGSRLVAVGGLTRDSYGTDPAVGRLRRIYVLPDKRRQGAGCRLVRALEAAAQRIYREVVLRTDTEAAAQFYEALGYTRLPPGGTATHWRRMAAARSARPEQ